MNRDFGLLLAPKVFSLDLAKLIRVGHVVNRTDQAALEVSAGSASVVRQTDRNLSIELLGTIKFTTCELSIPSFDKIVLSRLETACPPRVIRSAL